MNGSIDEVAIWNRTLSASEIQDIYLNTKQYRSMNTFVIGENHTNIAVNEKLISTGFYTPYVGQERYNTDFFQMLTSCFTWWQTGLLQCSDNCILGSKTMQTNPLIINGSTGGTIYNTGLISNLTSVIKHPATSGICRLFLMSNQKI
jgi:hypothetical protein